MPAPHCGDRYTQLRETSPRKRRRTPGALAKTTQAMPYVNMDPAET